jgi:hypothetical protein
MTSFHYQRLVLRGEHGEKIRKQRIHNMVAASDDNRDAGFRGNTVRYSCRLCIFVACEFVVCVFVIIFPL